MSTIGIVASAADGVDTLRAGLVEPIIGFGFRAALTLTPTAASWLDSLGELEAIEHLTQLPVRSQPRLPSEPRPHPPIELYVAAPLSANSTAKLALQIADNQALTALGEAIATVPMIVFPRINAAHARHPAWSDHLARLRSAGVDLIYGEDVWPLAEPGSEPDRRALPWIHIIDRIRAVMAR